MGAFQFFELLSYRFLVHRLRKTGHAAQLLVGNQGLERGKILRTVGTQKDARSLYLHLMFLLSDSIVLTV